MRMKIHRRKIRDEKIYGAKTKEEKSATCDKYFAYLYGFVLFF